MTEKTYDFFELIPYVYGITIKMDDENGENDALTALPDIDGGDKRRPEISN